MVFDDLDGDEIYGFRDFSCQSYTFGDGDETITIVSQNHGDEKGPRRVIEELLTDSKLDYDDLSLTVIPEANVYASEANLRETPLDVQPSEADEHDLNRTYETARKELVSENPNTQNLNTTEQAAYRILEHLEDLDPDLVVDMHSGTSGTLKMPQIRYKHRQEYPVEESEMSDVATNAGVEMVNTTPGEDAQMLGAVVPKMGIPAVTIEVGGGVRDGWEGAFEQSHAESYRDIVSGIINYRMEGLESGFKPREFSGIQKNHAPEGVSGEVEYHFDLGDEVLEGEKVATVTDGEEEHELFATTDGALETVLTESSREEITPGNRVFNLATRGDI